MDAIEAISIQSQNQITSSEPMDDEVINVGVNKFKLEIDPFIWTSFKRIHLFSDLLYKGLGPRL